MTTGDRIAALETADDRYHDAAATVDEAGETNLQNLADAHAEFTRLLAQYSDSATGSGDFQAFIEFQEKVQRFVDTLPSDLPERHVFERAADILDQRRLATADFDRARETLEPAKEMAARLDARAAALEDYRAARRAVTDHHRTITEQIDRLESLKEYANTDLSTDPAALKDPLETYDDAIDAAFEDFRATHSARDVIRFLDATTAYPLVAYPTPPAELKAYLTQNPIGEETIPTLLEYAAYSPSKLDYYVDDPQEFRVHIATNRTYLTSLDAAPLHIGWPPPPAEDLRWRTRELIPIVDRFAPDDVVAALHDVRKLTYHADYDRYREAALANEHLTPTERQKLETGEVDDELAQLRAEQSRLESALTEHPDR